MPKLSKSFKGQISKETEKAIEITVMDDSGIFTTWIPKSALNMKEMPVDYISVTGTQIFHVSQWFLDLKAKQKNTETEFIKEAEKQPEYETRTLSKDTIPNPDPKTTSNTQTVIIPAQPEHRPYFPAMTIFELRDYHLREQNGAIRGHIENIIMAKEHKELLDKILVSTEIMLDKIVKILEGKKK